MDYFHVILMVCLAGLICYDIGYRMGQLSCEEEEGDEEEEQPWGYVVQDSGVVDGGEPDWEGWTE
jgi:hypothetical protein